MAAETTKRARSNSPFIIAVVILVAALVVEGFLLIRPKPSRPIEAQRAISASFGNGQAGRPKPPEIITFGETSAPIKIEFYAPLTLEWHKKTIGLLREYDKAHPGHIHITLMPMGRAECDQEMEKRGYTCAVIFINGKTEFTLPNGKNVMLEKKPNTPDSFYNSEDVITIVEQLVK